MQHELLLTQLEAREGKVGATRKFNKVSDWVLGRGGKFGGAQPEDVQEGLCKCCVSTGRARRGDGRILLQPRREKK